jgi:hypothetical protein
VRAVAAVLALVFLPQAPSAAQERVAELVQQAVQATERGDHARALSCLKLAHRLDPARPDIKPAIAAVNQRQGQAFFVGGELGRAEACFREGIAFDQKSAGNWLGVARVAVLQKRFDEAEKALRQVSALVPTNVDVLIVLGSLLHDQRRHAEAVSILARAVELAPGNGVAVALLKKAQLDAAVEVEFTDHRSDRFVLAFHGERRGLERSVPEMLRFLEATWRELAERLGHRPEAKIVVLLYTETEFERLARSSDWVRAYYDGKVRVPLDSWTGQRRRVQDTIRHELAHAFVHDMAGHVTSWLHEGIAQWCEGESAERARGLLRSQPLVPAAALRASFFTVTDEAQVARLYAQSLALVGHLLEARGSDGIRWLLSEIARGRGAADAEEKALQTVYGQGLERLIEELATKHRLAAPPPR